MRLFVYEERYALAPAGGCWDQPCRMLEAASASAV